MAQLATILPAYIAQRRWFRAKTRTIEKAEIEDVLAVSGTRSYIAMIRLDYTDGESDNYVLTLAPADASGSARKSDAIARYRTRIGCGR